MKREAFFAECLSFAMPPNTVPPVLGGYINVVTGGRNDRKLAEVADCPSCAVPLRLY